MAMLHHTHYLTFFKICSKQGIHVIIELPIDSFLGGCMVGGKKAKRQKYEMYLMMLLFTSPLADPHISSKRSDWLAALFDVGSVCGKFNSFTQPFS